MGFIPYLLLDKSLIKQAMMNLLQNAMQSGAHIIDLRIYVTAEQVILEIEDDGVGISAENINKIFEPHFTTRKNGNGLGLTIVLRFCASMVLRLKWKVLLLITKRVCMVLEFV